LPSYPARRNWSGRSHIAWNPGDAILERDDAARESESADQEAAAKIPLIIIAFQKANILPILKRIYKNEQ
jgi:hypothetical protein